MKGSTWFGKLMFKVNFWYLTFCGINRNRFRLISQSQESAINVGLMVSLEHAPPWDSWCYGVQKIKTSQNWTIAPCISMVLCRLVRFSKCSTVLFSILTCPFDLSLVVNSMHNSVWQSNLPRCPASILWTAARLGFLWSLVRQIGSVESGHNHDHNTTTGAK